jgi:hypothetical protein
MTFSAERVPARWACGSADEAAVDGTGKWEYDEASGQLHLYFHQYLAAGECKESYAAVAFVDSPPWGTGILLFPDGADSAGSVVELVR